MDHEQDSQKATKITKDRKAKIKTCKSENEKLEPEAGLYPEEPAPPNRRLRFPFAMLCVPRSFWRAHAIDDFRQHPLNVFYFIQG
jgi:hypothetical protein